MSCPAAEQSGELLDGNLLEDARNVGRVRPQRAGQVADMHEPHAVAGEEGTEPAVQGAQILVAEKSFPVPADRRADPGVLGLPLLAVLPHGNVDHVRENEHVLVPAPPGGLTIPCAAKAILIGRVRHSWAPGAPTRRSSVTNQRAIAIRMIARPAANASHSPGKPCCENTAPETFASAAVIPTPAAVRGLNRPTMAEIGAASNAKAAPNKPPIAKSPGLDGPTTRGTSTASETSSICWASDQPCCCPIVQQCVETSEVPVAANLQLAAVA